MDYFFNKITDLGLRRIYKFILKRTIGKYLEDELLVEQLSVKSSEGLITLNDLKLNKDVINEEFCSLLPLRVVEISVNQLNLLLSYQKLLSDGCTFQVDELTIVIEPVDKLDTLNLAINSNCYDKKISSSSVHSDRRTHGVDPNSYENYVVHDIVNPYGDNLAVEDDKGQGLDFIAHWVEVIVAKLKVQVRKVVLVVKASNTSSSSYNSGSSSKSQDLRIELFGIKYFNTDPSVFSTSESSVELSSKLSAGQASGIAKELGARKIVTLDGISIAFANNSVSSNGENHVDPVNNFPEGNEFIVSRKNTQPLLRCPEGVNLRVRLDQLHSKLEGVDCDLTFPSLKLCFDASSVLSLLQILSQYSVAKSPAGSPSRVPYSDGANLSNSQIGRSVLESVLDSDKVLDWIVEQELRSKKVMNSSSKNVAGVSYVGDELDDIDFAAIIYKIKKHREAQAALQEEERTKTVSSKSFVSGFTPSLNWDTVEEYESNSVAGSDDIDDDDYFDAVEGRSIRSLKISQLKNKANTGKSTLETSQSSLKSSTSSINSGASTSKVLDNSVNLRIRVHIIHGDLSFVDFSDCEDAKCGRIAEEVFSELHCKFEEAIVTVQSKLSNTNANSSDSVKTSISVTSMELFEQNHSESSAFLQGESNYDEYRRILLSFYAPISHRSIIAAPAIDISIDQVTAACKNNLSSSGLHLSSINVSVLLQPAILSVYISQINKWAKVMSSLVSNVASQESTSNCNLSINCASVDVILHSDHKVPRQCWDDISFGCVLAGPNSDWRIVGKTQQSEAPLLSHLVDSYGGLLFTLENLNVVLQTFAYKSQPSVQTIEMDKLQASLLLSTEELPQLSLFNPTLEHKVRTYYTALIMVASSDPSQKVTISKESLSQIGTNEEDETDHSPDLGPIPPSVGRGSIIKLRAYLIDVDIKQTEYNAVIHLSETMDAQSSKLVAKYKASQTDSTSDPSPAANVENASSQQAKSSSNGIKFGLSFNSAYSKITIRENCKEDYVRDESSLDEDSASSDSTSSNLIDVPLESSAVCFTVSIREPTIEVLSVPEEVFVTLRANDLSMYDMTCEEYIELLDSHFNFLQSSSGQISRSGSNKHKLPFVRRAALHDNKQKYNDNMVYCYPTLLGNNSLFKSAFELRLQLTSSREATQSVHFFIDLYDIILSHEPSSIWILNLVALLTPLSVKQLVIRRKAVEFQDFTLCNDTAKEVCSPVAICVNQNGKEEKDAAFKSPFEITKVNVRIRDCVIDYCCPRINSRALFSIGLLTLSSTIVSNSKRFSLKFKALNFALYISNQILNDTENMDIDSEHTIAKKQSSHKSNQEVNFSTYKNLEEFLQQFSFVQLLSIDQLDNNVFFHKTTLEDLALQIGVGMCTISGCIDSLNLFVETVKIWSTELQASCVRSNILLSKQQALVKASRDYKEDVDEELDPVLDGVSKVRIITEDEPNFIKRDSLREKCEQVAPIQVTSPSVTIPRNTQAVVTNDRIMDDTVLTGTSVVVHSEKNIREVTMGMEELVVDNYFHSVATNKYDPVDEKNGAEYEAQWIAQYDYGDEESNCSFEPYEEEDNKTVENVLEGRTHQAFDDRRKPIDDDSDRESEAENEFDLSSGVRHSKPEKMEYELQYMQSSKLLPGVSSPQDIGNTAAFESIESVFDPSSLSELYSYYQQQKEDGDDEKNYSDGDGSNVGADEEGGYESRYEPNSDDGSSGRDHDEEDNYDDDEYEEYTDSSPRSDGKENSLSPKKEEINQGFRFDEPETGFVEKTAEQVLTERNMVGIENNKEVQNVIPDERDKVLFTNASQWPVEVQRELEELDKAWEVDELTTAPNLTPRNSDSYVSSRQVSSELVKTEEVADDFNVFGQKAQWYVLEEEVKIEQHYIPAVSERQLQEIPDNRPEEEKLRHCNLLVTVRGGIKIRLFVGRDWVHDNYVSIAPADEVKIKSDQEQIATNSQSESKRSISADSLPGTKSVRFSESELVHELMGDIPPAHNKNSTRQGISASPTSRPKLFTPQRIQQKEEQLEINESMPLPREEKDMVDLSFKDFIFSLRTYDDVDFRKLAVDPITGQSVIAHYVPAQRMLISAYDMLVSFGRVGKRRKKVLGQWATPLRPRNYLQPLIQVALVAYPASIPLEKLDIGNISEEVPLEYSIFMRMLPVRCYLDYHLIEFFRKFSVKSESTNSNESDSVDENSQDDEEENEPVSKHISLISSSTTTSDSRFVIKSLSVAQTDIKIDYTGSLFNINALKTGDYLQLLNIMPLDGLELTLKDLQMQNLPGIEKYLDVLLQHWVKDIYDNQLHRVISGTAPLRGLTNIGSDLKKLLFIPLNDYRSHSKNSNHVMKELGKGTNTLMRTITREALSVSHAATMFVANTLSDIVQGDERMLRRNSFSGRGRISNYTDIDQPKGLMEGIGRAYSSVTREVNAAMDTVIAIPIEQYEGSGSTGKYVKSVIRALPVAVLRPISGIAEGLSYTILGLRNDLDPFARMEEQDMWNVDLLPPDITSTLMARSQELSSSTVSTKDKGNNHTQKPAAGTSSKAKGSGSNSSKHSSHSASAKRDDSAKGSSSRSSRGSTRSSNDNTHYITTKKTNAEQAASKRR